ncbi:putative Atrial natriuretic peptide receptor 1, partial [Hypsibius exemplaris]
KKELQFESTNTIHRKIHEMVARCLESESHARPTATDLKRWLTTVRVPKKNFVELLLDRLEKHSASLEETVQSRTEALLDETRKVDDLLREILPSAIITKLRNHQPIIAEIFDSVTIMFSDIPAFGLIVAQSEPLEVIDFLNHLHTAFDRVVAQFDAYKVETINDSYVVASGLPVRNGDRHAEAICRLAQQLLRAGTAVHIPAWGYVTICPRIGINSANKIHVSSSTYELVEEARLRTKDAERDHLVFKARGFVPIKGKGLVNTFWLSSSAANDQQMAV